MNDLEIIDVSTTIKWLKHIWDSHMLWLTNDIIELELEIWCKNMDHQVEYDPSGFTNPRVGTR